MNHYFKFSQFLKERFQTPVHKIVLDAGFNCPNRDGTKGTGGCIFCNNSAFSPSLKSRGIPITEQIQKSLKKFQYKNKIQRFLAYFQPFSNTYCSPDYLRSIFNEALSFHEIIGIAVGTRPDCLPDKILEIIAEYSQKTHFWLEIGLESIHNKTLERINRGHTYQEFLDSFLKVRKIPNLFICIHLIHGLPGETKEMMLETVKEITLLKPDAVKFHQLEIVKNTALEKDYLENKINLLSLEEYIEILCESVQYLDKKIIIQRLFGFTPSELLVAPNIDKKQNLNQLIDSYFKQKNVFQGSKT